MLIKNGYFCNYEGADALRGLAKDILALTESIVDDYRKLRSVIEENSDELDDYFLGAVSGFEEQFDVRYKALGELAMQNSDKMTKIAENIEFILETAGYSRTDAGGSGTVTPDELRDEELLVDDGDGEDDGSQNRGQTKKLSRR